MSRPVPIGELLPATIAKLARARELRYAIDNAIAALVRNSHAGVRSLAYRTAQARVDALLDRLFVRLTES